MSQNKMTAAREFIDEKNYQVARAILESLPANPTVVNWLQELNTIEPNNQTLDNTRQKTKPIYSIPAPVSSPSPPSKRIAYEYKTVKIVYTFNYDRAMNDKIKELGAQGWEFLSYTDEGRTHLFGGRVTDARILSFQRPV